jgi:hypothetical protein
MPEAARLYSSPSTRAKDLAILAMHVAAARSADVIDRPLHRQGVPFLRALHDDHGADHLGGCGHVELQGFAVLWRS